MERKRQTVRKRRRQRAKEKEREREVEGESPYETIPGMINTAPEGLSEWGSIYIWAGKASVIACLLARCRRPPRTPQNVFIL